MKMRQLIKGLKVSTVNMGPGDALVVNVSQPLKLEHAEALKSAFGRVLLGRKVIVLDMSDISLTVMREQHLPMGVVLTK